MDFVHHQAVRPIAAEGRLRKDLRELTKYAAAGMLLLWYQHGIKLCDTMNAPDVPDEKAARDSVLAHKAMSGWSRLEGIVFSLGRLPAAPKFYRKKQNRKTKTAVNFTVGNWADSESD